MKKEQVSKTVKATKIVNGLAEQLCIYPTLNIVALDDPNPTNTFILSISAYLPELKEGNEPIIHLDDELVQMATDAGPQLARCFLIRYQPKPTTGNPIYSLWEFKVTYSYSGASATMVYVGYDPVFSSKGMRPETPRGTVTTGIR